MNAHLTTRVMQRASLFRPGHVALLAIASALGSRAGAQLPGPPPSGMHGCLRPDVAKSTALIEKAAATGAEVTQVMKEVTGCTSYTVTFQSTVTLASKLGTKKITGRGAITFGLAPDPSEPDFDLTSGPTELTGPVLWSDAAITLTNGCTVTVVAMPWTAFSFWLGVKDGTQPKVGVAISPAGDEQHFTKTRCPSPAGGSRETPGRDLIFTPLWSALHANAGAPVASAAGPIDPARMKEMMGGQAGGGLDMKKLEELGERFKNNPPKAADMQDVGKTIKGVVPGADSMLTAARENYMFRMPGDCTVASATVVRCTVTKPAVSLKDVTGSTQTLSESTVITIIRGGKS